MAGRQRANSQEDPFLTDQALLEFTEPVFFDDASQILGDRDYWAATAYEYGRTWEEQE